MTTKQIDACFDMIGHPKNESRQEFERRYASQSPGVIFGVNMVSIPCTCEHGRGLVHWAAISNTEDALRDHLDHERCLADLRLGGEGNC